MTARTRDDGILPETRWVAALVIPFLAVAFVILYFFPQDTARLFAWKLQPRMSALMLGAAYAGGIYFFAGLLLSRKWHRVKAGILPVCTFATLLGIATVLHWDRFNHNHVSFWAWAGLYFTTPFIVAAVWLRNRGRDPGQAEPGDVPLPGPARWTIGGIGAVTLAVSLALFFWPALMLGPWPWALTPLTARVMGAMFALPGVVGLGIAFDRRWRAARLILQSQSFSILLILVGVVRAWGDFDPAKPGTWLFTGGLTAMLAGIAALYAFMAARAGRTGPVAG